MVTVSPLMVAESAGSVTLNGSPDLRIPEVVPKGEVTVELFAKVVDAPEELVAIGIELFSDVEVSSVVADGVETLFVQLTNRAASRPKIVMAIIIFFFMFFSNPKTKV